MKTLCLESVYLQRLHEYKCVQVEVKPGHHMSSFTSHFTVLRQGLSLNQKFALLARLDGKLANELLGSTCLYTSMLGMT